MKKNGREKRQAERVPLECHLRFRVVPTRQIGFVDAWAHDVSMSGFRFHCRELIPRESSLLVEMDFLGHTPIRSLAKAVWIRERPLEEGYEVGSKFVEPPGGTKTTLGQLVSGH